MTEKPVSFLSVTSFYWLLASLVFLMLPHVERYLLLLTPLLFISLFWRYMVFKNRLPLPSSLFKVLLVGFGFSSIFLLPFPWFSLESAVAILLVGVLLKLIEMNSRRDLLVLLYLAYFVIVAQLLFDQTLVSALYMLVGILLVTTSLVSIMSNSEQVSWVYPLTFASRMMLFSAPVMVLGFLLFPRLDAFWSVPMPKSGQAKTGISDQMEPGDIQNLIKSNEVVFRVEFEGKIPARNKLYWRGPVLSVFDGKRWTMNKESSEPFQSQKSTNKDDVLYKLYMEPSFDDWVFPLHRLVASDKTLYHYADDRWKSPENLTSKTAFNWVSRQAGQVQSVLNERLKADLLALPEDKNPKTLTFAQTLRAEMVSDVAYVKAINQFFLDNPFYYSLNPPLYPDAPVDAFLFEKMTGFCGHFSSAYAMLMRAGGIPSRVVTGYQGGEVNDFQDYLTVRQKDAHAWVEIWLNNRWVRVDPTSFVAPHRILEGSEEFLTEDPYWQSQQLIAGAVYDSTWYQYALHRYDQLNHLWTVSVLEYSDKHQIGLMKTLWGKVDWQKLALWGAGCFLAIVLVLYALLNLPSRIKLSVTARQYQRLLKKLDRKGIHKPPHMGPKDFLNYIQRMYPVYYSKVKPAIQLYIELTYQQSNKNLVDQSKQLKRLVAAL